MHAHTVTLCACVSAEALGSSVYLDFCEQFPFLFYVFKMLNRIRLVDFTTINACWLIVC